MSNREIKINIPPEREQPDIKNEKVAQDEVKESLLMIERIFKHAEISYMDLISSARRFKEVRDAGLEIDELIDVSLGKIIESRVYNKILEYYDKFDNDNLSSENLESVCMEIEHTPFKLRGGLSCISNKDQNFFIDLTLLVANAFENHACSLPGSASLCYQRAINYYDEVGAIDKSKKLVVEALKKYTEDFDETKFDYDREKNNHYAATVMALESGDRKESERVQPAEIYGNEIRLNIEKMKNEMRVFLEKYSAKKDMDEVALLEVIRQKMIEQIK